MGLDLTPKIERLLTRLGLWGALRGVVPLAAAIVLSVALLESFAAPAARLFSFVPANLIHVFAVGTGLLLGLIGHFAADTWDLLFEMFYGPRGKWLAAGRGPLFVFPAGSALTRHRGRAAQALSRRSDTMDAIYRDAVKVARRQVERWEGIERPLILSRLVQSLLWPGLFATMLALAAAAIVPLVGAAAETPRFLVAAGGCFVLLLVCLVPYSHLRVEHMTRLYRDVAGHGTKKKPGLTPGRS